MLSLSRLKMRGKRARRVGDRSPGASESAQNFAVAEINYAPTPRMPNGRSPDDYRAVAAAHQEVAAARRAVAAM
jgi:hypothetical protein